MTRGINVIKLSETLIVSMCIIAALVGVACPSLIAQIRNSIGYIKSLKLHSLIRLVKHTGCVRLLKRTTISATSFPALYLCLYVTGCD